MNNNIVRSSFYFHPLISNFDNWKFTEVKKGDSLIVLKELDLMIFTTFATVVGRRRATKKLGFSSTSDFDVYHKLCDRVQNEFNKTGKIKGYEVLNLRMLDKIWISKYDMEILAP